MEGYHSQLKKKLVSKGNFCKFLACLLEQDFKISVDLENSLDGTYGIFQPPKQLHKKRAELIERATNNLINKKITLEDFMNQMTNWQNNIISTDNLFEEDNSVLLIPCNHFKIGADCFLNHSERAIRNENSKVLCPVCRQIVINSTKFMLNSFKYI